MLADEAKLKLLQAAYWEFETPWQDYRRKTADTRDAAHCGDLAIRSSAKNFLQLFDKWKEEHPLPSHQAWFISLSGMPVIGTWIPAEAAMS